MVCLLAFAWALTRRSVLRERYRGYLRFLLVPWKLGTFAVALAGITLIAPYTGDPYWDYTVAAVMALGSFFTAPWALAVFYRAPKGIAPLSDVAFAACAWLFTASWSYDGWNFLRFGEYPLTWAANLPASSLLYLMAGLFWSFDHRAGKPQISFAQPEWPRPSSPGAFLRLLPWCAPMMALVSYLIVGFVFGWL
jgi:hypothetical protein